MVRDCSIERRWMVNQPEKVCVICGQSCAGQPRIKDAQGNYAHRACVDAKIAQEHHQQEQLPVDDAGMEGMWDDLPEVEEPAAPAGAPGMCPSCGQRISPEHVLCVHCGFNTKTGKAMKQRVLDTSSGRDSKVLKVGAAAGGMALKPVFPLIGALVAGLIGAALWAGIVYFTNYEVGIVAWAIGGMVGIGAAIGARGEGGALTGAMAAIVAMASIVGGKYAVAYIVTHQGAMGIATMSEMTIDDVDDEWATGYLADKHIQEKLDNGQRIEWDNIEAYLHSAMWPDDYPRDIQRAAEAKWSSMSPAQKMSYKEGLAVDPDYDGEFSVEDIDDDWALDEIAMDLCREQDAAGKTVGWPDPNLPLEGAVWPDDYPSDIRSEVQDRWDAMSEGDRDTVRSEIVAQVNEFTESFSQAMNKGTNSIFNNLMMHPLNILFMMLAVVTAYKIAANEE